MFINFPPAIWANDMAWYGVKVQEEQIIGTDAKRAEAEETLQFRESLGIERARDHAQILLLITT